MRSSFDDGDCYTIHLKDLDMANTIFLIALLTERVHAPGPEDGPAHIARPCCVGLPDCW